MNLTIESTSRCQYCHPETCNCPDYVLKLGDITISSGDRSSLETVKQALGQWRADTTDAERDCKDCEGLLEDITELNKELNPEAYGIVDAERAALLERIEESCSKPCEMHSDHEKALYLLADIREYLSGVKL